MDTDNNQYQPPASNLDPGTTVIRKLDGVWYGLLTPTSLILNTISYLFINSAVGVLISHNSTNFVMHLYWMQVYIKNWFIYGVYYAILVLVIFYFFKFKIANSNYRKSLSICIAISAISTVIILSIQMRWTILDAINPYNLEHGGYKVFVVLLLKRIPLGALIVGLVSGSLLNLAWRTVLRKFGKE